MKVKTKQELRNEIERLSIKEFQLDALINFLNDEGFGEIYNSETELARNFKIRIEDKYLHLTDI